MVLRQTRESIGMRPKAFSRLLMLGSSRGEDQARPLVILRKLMGGPGWALRQARLGTRAAELLS